MDTSPLKDFLADIAIDPVRYAEFVRDAGAAVRSAGLPAESRSAVCDGDSRAIAARIAVESGTAASNPGSVALMVRPQCPGPLELFEPLD